MAAQIQAAAALRRALAYPYESPSRSFLQVGDRARELDRSLPLDPGKRRPLLAYGANVAPSVLSRKLAGLTPEPLPVLRGELVGFDVVFSAHVSPYGAVPATLQRSAQTTVAVFVLLPTPAQRRRLTATEPNYELGRLGGARLRVDRLGAIEDADAYVSRHGCLALDGGEAALAAVPARGRGFPERTQGEVLDRVRRLLAPELDRERFVVSGLDPALAAARTATLRASAIAFRG